MSARMTSPNIEWKVASAPMCAAWSIDALASLAMMVRKFIRAASRAGDSQRTLVAAPAMTTVSQPHAHNRRARSEPSGMKALKRRFSIRSSSGRASSLACKACPKAPRRCAASETALTAPVFIAGVPNPGLSSSRGSRSSYSFAFNAMTRREAEDRADARRGEATRLAR